MLWVYLRCIISRESVCAPLWAWMFARMTEEKIERNKRVFASPMIVCHRMRTCSATLALCWRRRVRKRRRNLHHKSATGEGMITRIEELREREGGFWGLFLVFFLFPPSRLPQPNAGDGKREEPLPSFIFSSPLSFSPPLSFGTQLGLLCREIDTYQYKLRGLSCECLMPMEL